MLCFLFIQRRSPSNLVPFQRQSYYLLSFQAELRNSSNESLRWSLYV